VAEKVQAAVDLVKRRWDKTPKEKRTQIARDLAAASAKARKKRSEQREAEKQ
jgi:hypothetical protein